MIAEIHERLLATINEFEQDTINGKISLVVPVKFFSTFFSTCGPDDNTASSYNFPKINDEPVVRIGRIDLDLSGLEGILKHRSIKYKNPYKLNALRINEVTSKTFDSGKDQLVYHINGTLFQSRDYGSGIPAEFPSNYSVLEYSLDVDEVLCDLSYHTEEFLKSSNFIRLEDRKFIVDGKPQSIGVISQTNLGFYIDIPAQSTVYNLSLDKINLRRPGCLVVSGDAEFYVEDGPRFKNDSITLKDVCLPLEYLLIDENYLYTRRAKSRRFYWLVGAAAALTSVIVLADKFLFDSISTDNKPKETVQVPINNQHYNKDRKTVREHAQQFIPNNLGYFNYSMSRGNGVDIFIYTVKSGDGIIRIGNSFNFLDKAAGDNYSEISYDTAKGYNPNIVNANGNPINNLVPKRKIFINAKRRQ